MSSSKPSRRSPPSTISRSPPKNGKPSSSTTTTTTKRLLQELSQLKAHESERQSGLLASATGTASEEGISPIERLAPASDDSLFHWEAVLSGRGLGGGYDGGRWLLDVVVPEGYPNAPPTVRFVTRIVAANVGFEKGDICLDLLKDAWTPAYTLKMTVEAIWQMLAAPGIDSPLNVDIAALIRQGDKVGSEGVVRWGCAEWRFEGR